MIPAKISKTFKLLVCILLCLSAAEAQESVPRKLTLPDAKTAAVGNATDADYSKEASVVEEMKLEFRFDNDGTGTEVQYSRVRIQSPSALQNWGQIIISYSSAYDRVKVDYVRVHKPNKEVVTAGPDALQDLSSPVERIAPVYTDIRQIHITVPDLAVGDVLEYQIRTESVHPIVPGQFFLRWNSSKQFITLKENFQVDVPRDRTLHVKTASTLAPPQIQDQGDRRIYTWHSSFTNRPSEEEEAKEKKKAETAKSAPDDASVSTFQTWDQVGKWYAGLGQTQAVATDAIRSKAAELVAGRATDIEKAQAIYDYVSLNIRYVSLSFGVGRYQPHTAAEVLANQYGDCKDKSTLLVALLSAVKIPAYPALINSQHEIDSEIPSPLQFDHLIDVVSLDGKNYWADTTPGASPFGYLLPTLRDKLALAIPPDKAAGLEQTPATAPFTARESFDVEGRIDATGKLEGTLHYSSTGDSAVGIRAVLLAVSPTFWNRMAVTMMKATMSEHAKASDTQFKGVNDLEAPIELDARFAEPGFLDISKKNVSLDLTARNVTLPDISEPDADSKEPLVLGTPREMEDHWKVELPASLQLKVTLPMAVHVTREYGDYTSHYSLKDGAFEFDRKLIIRQPNIPPSWYQDYAAFRNVTSSDLDQKLTLENPSPGVAGVDSELSVDELYHESKEAYSHANYAQAIKLLQAVLEKDPKHAGAWNDLGDAYNRMSRYDEAVPALQKAIEQNAYDVNAYNSLGQAYQGLGRNDDAIHAFAKQIEINPLDNYAHANLGSVYLEEKKYDLAQKEYEAAIQLNSKDLGIYNGLGEADLGLHQEEAALQVFQHILEQAPVPDIWNSVAYTLSKYGVRLDLADQLSMNAVRAVEAQLDGSSLEAAGRVPAELMWALANFWDTVGWVKFKQGDLKSAENHLQASWAITDFSTVAEHLGEVYEKQGLRTDAKHAYALALACEQPSHEARERLVAMLGSDDDLQKLVDDARPDLAGRRTVKVPNPGKRNGTAEFWVLVSKGVKAEDVKLASGDASLEPMSQELRKMRLPVSIPEGESTKLLLRGALSCSTLIQECEFVVFPVWTVFDNLSHASQ